MAPRRTTRAAVLLVVGCVLGIHAAVPATIGQDWSSYSSQLQSVTLNGASLSASLGPVMQYTYSTPITGIQSASVYSAQNARFRRVVHDLIEGNPIKLVAVGGVATNASDASSPGSNDYLALYVNYLTTAFPRAQIETVRSSAGIAPSAVVAQCLGSFLPDDADMVLLEMTASDAVGMDDSIVDGHNAKAYEVLMRKILSSQSQPALLLVQSIAPGMGNGNTPYYLTPEAPQYAALASYYGTPILSMRNALWQTGNANGNSLTVINAVQQTDGSTPVDAGHKALADMLVYKTQRAAQDLLVLPYGDYDTTSIAGDVPEKPAYADVSSEPDVVLSNSTCLWLKNISSDGTCPTNMADMCNLDYSNTTNMLRSYNQFVSTAPKKNIGAIVGGVIGGVVGGLLVMGGLLYCCIISKKKQQERVARIAESRAAAKKKAAEAAAAAKGGAVHSITASAETAAVKDAGIGKDTSALPVARQPMSQQTRSQARSNGVVSTPVLFVRPPAPRV